MWHDFLEAFEHVYLVERLPVDVISAFQRRMDPKGCQHISKVVWSKLITQARSCFKPFQPKRFSLRKCVFRILQNMFNFVGLVLSCIKADFNIKPSKYSRCSIFQAEPLQDLRTFAPLQTTKLAKSLLKNQQCWLRVKDSRTKHATRRRGRVFRQDRQL